MEPPGGRDSRFNLGYNMNLLSGESSSEIYGNPNLVRPSTSLQQLSPRHTMVSSACNRGLKSDIYDDRALSGQSMGLDSCVNEINEDSYSMQSKKSPPSNGKKTKGRVKIKMEYIENKLRRYTTFSKRKTGIMKKAYELSTLTGTQVMLLVASETGHVYTFATRKLQPMITSEAGKALIQTCLNSPDPPAGSAGGDQRMSATGFEETELTYNISDDDSKSDGSGSDISSDEEMEETVECSENQQHAPQTEATSQNRSEKKEFEKSNAVSEVRQEREPRAIAPIVATTESTQRTGETCILPFPNPTTTAAEVVTPIGSNISSTLGLTMGAIPSTSLGVSPALTGAVSSTTNRLQALPLVLQTSAGIGYATTPDGMILGLLQGPNIVQPQLVAIPMPNVSGLSGISGANVSQKTDLQSDTKKS